MDSDELYGLPLDRFIAERGALARSLRGDGRREEATAVAALRKPSVAAWAVNQLVRTQPKPVADLFAAGDQLREVQSAVLDGREAPAALRVAVEAERAAVDALIAAASGLLSSEGHELSPAVLDRVAETLNAAALDDDARASVEGGRLQRELRHVGLGGGALVPEPAAKRSKAAPRAGKPRAAKAPKAKSPDARRPDAKRPDAKLAERERADARRAARIAEAEARREADRAARALNIAQERRQRAAEALREADEALAGATDEAESATEAHRRARDELDRT